MTRSISQLVDLCSGSGLLSGVRAIVVRRFHGVASSSILRSNGGETSCISFPNPNNRSRLSPNRAVYSLLHLSLSILDYFYLFPASRQNRTPVKRKHRAEEKEKKNIPKKNYKKNPKKGEAKAFLHRPHLIDIRLQRHSASDGHDQCSTTDTLIEANSSRPTV